ncbi:hypothetical protein QN372_16035 [Undibacterium sp. RTI2.1]|nr:MULTISPECIES: hypothetical protein [unclassified Undibacterium]MEB0032268.1 hypothetical protein [Undibacterium sp. RTI2.1]MEB0118404.1 hypothetical protein [Undibacterium sp. RTI2.2]
MQLFHGALQHKDKTNYSRTLLSFDQQVTTIKMQCSNDMASIRY